MLTRQRWLVLALAAALASCQDATAPRSPGAAAVAGVTADLAVLGADSVAHILREALAAPQLETYQVSFWVRRDRLTQVTVNYTNGQPFLWFDIPKDGLQQNASGWRFRGKDSVLVTLTIDTATFVVDLEPSGLMFKNDRPAMLVFWYENADPDLNGDGVVDSTDAALREQLHIVTRPVKRAHWHPAKGANGQALPYVYAYLRHFSQWAVSW